MRYAEQVDNLDQILLVALREDATQSYAALGKLAGLSAGAAHERVRKLRERGVIRRTTIDVDPVAVGRPVLAFVLVESNAWMGEEPVHAALRAIPELEEAHVIAGSASLLVKIRTGTTEELQDVLRRLFTIDGVSGTQTIVVLETVFEGAGGPQAPSDSGD